MPSPGSVDLAGDPPVRWPGCRSTSTASSYPRDGEGLGLRPRPPVRRRRVRGHPRLQPPHLPPRARISTGSTPRRGRWRSTIPLSPGEMADGGATRPCARNRQRGRLHPPDRHARRRRSRHRPAHLPEAERDHHRHRHPASTRASSTPAGIKVITSATRQVSHEAVDPRIKSLNYLKNVLAKIDAQRAGAARGDHAERRRLHRRVQRRQPLRRARRRGAHAVAAGRRARRHHARRRPRSSPARRASAAREARLTRYDVYTADECFLTGTGAEVMPVTEADGRPIGDGTPGPDHATAQRGVPGPRAQRGRAALVSWARQATIRRGAPDQRRATSGRGHRAGSVAGTRGGPRRARGRAARRESATPAPAHVRRSVAVGRSHDGRRLRTKRGSQRFTSPSTVPGATADRFWPTTSRIAVMTPDVWTRRPPQWVDASTSRRTRSGCRSASSWPIMPPIDSP